ncbi:putative transcription factor Homeodomain-TALE-KNOX family [Helianthus annuus]|nr:putative transcription factor Homeodomain-TALE-KNOX family [Helianthus annuus]KAJ0663763.1 putative transcription factor Homeodomain-TALE-KNOX family [Helianthus annuus]KAJ0849272.1 putative transcription factor Homeodomain-TALE-KNOX family [Helianthus annuus]KAJ0858267.1 putative transcription factor Homeodomain-TALE-KNOX family [Helianthus annuus]
MAFHPNNHLSQEMALQQHFTDTDNISVLRTILPPDHHHHLQSSPSSRSAGKDHWLNSAILRQQGQYGNEGGSSNNNFLNLQTNNHNNNNNSDSAVTTSSQHNNNNNQWLSRSMLQRNVSDVRGDDIVSQVSNDSVIVAAAGMSSHDSPDLTRNMVSAQVDNNGVGELGDSEVGGGGDGVSGGEAAVNWQNARYKAEVLSHPLYEQLLSAHVSCLRIATPVDQLPRIDAQLAQSQHVVAKYSGLGGQGGNLGDDKELDQFMTHYVLLLCSFKEQLQQHVRVHAMEAVMACWEIEQSLQSLTGVSPGEGTGATMSDDDEDQVDSDANLFDGSFDGHDSMGFGPLVPTESERSLMERVRQELKHELKQGYKEKIVDIREEILRKRRAGKLPGDTTSVLKSWWQSHAKWPYPTEEDKARLVQETGLQLKQINNWFINQRKRNWHSNPSSSTVLKSKRKR